MKMAARGKAALRPTPMDGRGFFKARTDVLDHPHATLAFSDLAKIVANVRSAKDHERREALLRVSALL